MPKWTSALIRRDTSRSEHHFSGLSWPSAGVVLSVQGSKHHHSSPKMTFSKASRYNAFEVSLTASPTYKNALIKEMGEDGKYLIPTSWDGTIIPGVPKNAIEKLLGILVKLHGPPEILQ